MTIGESVEPGNYVIMGAEDDVRVEVREQEKQDNGFGGYTGDLNLSLSDDSIYPVTMPEGTNLGFPGAFYMTPIAE